MTTETKHKTTTPRLFLDCDGVLADFDAHAKAYFGMDPRAYEARMGSKAFWAELEALGDFYRKMPLRADAMELYEGVKHLNPTILTGCPRGEWAQQQKIDWAAEHFPGVPIIVCRSSDKRNHANPGDILIDDWNQHRHRWIEMGGVWITHTCAQTSLAALDAHLSTRTSDARIAELEAENARLRAYGREQFDRARKAEHGLWALGPSCTPATIPNLRRMADEMDCGVECEHLSPMDMTTGVRECHLSDKGECPFDDACELRDLADALETRTALGEQP